MAAYPQDFTVFAQEWDSVLLRVVYFLVDKKVAEQLATGHPQWLYAITLLPKS
jgi:hypothetical protein